MADIPEIHIWKDGRALWPIYNQDSQRYEFYETMLAQDEVTEVKSILANAGYWLDTSQGHKDVGSSYRTIWTDFLGQEKSVVVRNHKFVDMISALHKLLESSTHVKEYIPESGYLFANPATYFSTGYPWPDESIRFSQLTDGIYVDGQQLATAWDAVQSGDSIIVSNRAGYWYRLKIPEISCVFSYDGVKDVCTMYSSTHP